MATCDEIFDRLLDGETRARDVVEHLQHCPRCRAMQSIVEPIVSVGQSSSGTLSSSSSDGWTSTGVSPEAESIARGAAERLAAGEHQHSVASGGVVRTTGRKMYWPYLAAFAMGAVASLAVAAGLTSQQLTPSGMNGAAVCLWTSRNVRDPKSDDVVLTCVACHLTPSPHR
ncbi:MAG: hypothetical protein KDA80_04335 [Planctomycetaceae bacterium]|nr:hypothetical protein [Planctomycetaceae bacterium]